MSVKNSLETFKRAQQEQVGDIKNYIDVGAVLHALENHIINGGEMTATQVNAALAILKKAFPDKPVTDKDGGFSYEDALKRLE